MAGVRAGLMTANVHAPGSRLRLAGHRLGLRRQRVGAAAGREGLLGRRAGVRRRFADEDFPKSTWDLRRYYWMPKLGLRGILRLTLFKDIFIASGCGVGGGSLGYANTLYRARPAFFETQQSELADQGSGAAPPLRHRRADARRRRVRGDGPGRPAAARVRRGARRRRDVRQHPRRRVLRRAGKQVADPYFGGEGPGRGRLHALRQLHGRLPPQRQEHAGQELPLVRREARGRDPPRAAGDRDPAAGRRRRLRRLRGDQRALRRLAANRAPDHDRPRGRRRRRRLGTNKLLRQLPGSSGAAGTFGPARPRGANQQRVDPGRDRTRRQPRLRARSRSPRASTPTPTRTSRWSPTARAATR